MTLKEVLKHPEYLIVAYDVMPDTVVLFVREYTAAQEEIPSVLDGRSVRIAKSI